MSDIGPELPPHLLAKRKRKQEAAATDASATTSGAKRSPSPDAAEKRRKVLGPAMPPAPLEERPTEPARPAEESDSEDDDGFGPALPPDGAIADANQDLGNLRDQEDQHEQQDQLKRDEWMMMPPKEDDLAARLDPTKQRPRTFNTGKGAKGPNAGGDDSSSWYETPEQKQKRLADEMMGVAKPASAGPQKPNTTVDTAKNEAAAKKIREHTEKTRGPSLMDRHHKSKGIEAEDDPSKRAFDREKDMSSGMRVGHTQRKEMLNKASGFSSKFSGGSYL